MEIVETLINRESGQPYEVIYRDIDAENDFAGKEIKGARAYCFCGDKIVVTHEAKGHWSLVGGGIEEGEEIRAGIRREVREETNMQVEKMRFVGLLEVREPEGTWFYIWAVCLVTPYGPFQKDPAEEVSEIKLIEPAEVAKVTSANFKRIGERILKRALEAKALMQVEINFERFSRPVGISDDSIRF